MNLGEPQKDEILLLLNAVIDGYSKIGDVDMRNSFLNNVGVTPDTYAIVYTLVWH